MNRLCTDVRCGLPSDHEGPCVPDEEEEATPRHPGCDQCQMLNINGVNCHEHGCPNQNKYWNEEREQWVRYFKCIYCGDEIEEGERCNCDDPLEEADDTEFCECGRKPEDCTTFETPDGDHNDRESLDHLIADGDVEAVDTAITDAMDR